MKIIVRKKNKSEQKHTNICFGGTPNQGSVKYLFSPQGNLLTIGRKMINGAEQRAKELTNPLTHSLYVHKVKTHKRERTISSINSAKKTGDYTQITKHLISHLI